jgi:glycosyltransferase involved in cell wall biosynthesis
MIAELYPDHVSGGQEQASRKRIAVAAADLIFCVSENTKTDLIANYATDADKVVVTPLASSLGAVTPKKYFNSIPYILYVGQRGGYKNFRSLCEAFVSSQTLRREFQLICFGGPPFNRHERELMSALPADGLGSVRHMAGDDQLLVALYRNATLYVCPSLYEGFGLPVLEAMSCECPVLGSQLGSIPEIGGDAIAYLDGVHSEAVRASIEKLIFDTSQMGIMRASGLMRSMEFSWSRTAKISLAGYKSVLAQ